MHTSTLVAALDVAHRRVMLWLGLMLGLIGLCFLAILMTSPDAFADTVSTVASNPDGPVTTTTSVTLPIGDWIGAAAEFIAAIAAAGIVWLFRFLPAGIRQVLTTMQADQLLGKAIDYAINAVAGAEKGKTLDVKVGSAVVAQAVQYVIDHGPEWLISWLGGWDAIEQKIIARLSLSAETAVVTTASVVPASVAPAATAQPLSVQIVSAPATA